MSGRVSNKKVLITGAAGRLGTELRRGLAPLARKLRLADVADIRDLKPNEEALQFDLADMEAAIRASEGVDAIVHFGGVPLEGCRTAFRNHHQVESSGKLSHSG